MSVTRLMIVVAWVGVCLGSLRANVVVGLAAMVVAIFSSPRASTLRKARIAGGSIPSMGTELADAATSAAVVVLIAASGLIAAASPLGLVLAGGVAWSTGSEATWLALKGATWFHLLLIVVPLVLVIAGVVLANLVDKALRRRFWPPSTDLRATLRASGLVLAAWGLVGVEAVGFASWIEDAKGLKIVREQERAAGSSRVLLDSRRRCLIHVERGPDRRCDTCRDWSPVVGRAEVARWEVGANLDLDNARNAMILHRDSPIHRWRFAWLAAILLPPLLAVPLAFQLGRELASPARERSIP